MNVPLLHFIDLIISWWESWCSWTPCPRPLVAWRQKACAENANVLIWPAYWYGLDTSLNTKQFIESTTWRRSLVSLVFKEPPTVSQLSFHLEVKCSQTNRNWGFLCPSCLLCLFWGGSINNHFYKINITDLAGFFKWCFDGAVS